MKKYLFSVLVAVLFVFSDQTCDITGQTLDTHRIVDKPGNYIINDFKFYPTPNIPRPQKGVTFQDPIFHANITRITDSAREAHGEKYDYTFPGYPKHDIENADGTMLIIQSFSGSTWNIWNAKPPYNKIKEIPPSIIGWGRPLDVRWDRDDPNIIYWMWDYGLCKYNVKTGEYQRLHDFRKEFPPRSGEQYPTCGPTLQEEGDASDDRRYWAFNMICHDPDHSPMWYSGGYVVYDKDYYGKDKGKIISMIRPTDPKFRVAGFVSMSPSGKYVWIGDTHALYPRDFSSVRELGFCCHADMAISAEGREVIFGFNQRPGKKEYWSIMADLETGEITYLSPIGGPRYHFSGNSYSTPGWGVVSTYYPQYPNPEKDWGDHEVFMVELTKRKDPPPRVWRIAHTHTVFKDGYADAPFAKINRRGTKIWFGSGWGHSCLDKQPDGNTRHPYDVYQIDLPQTWYHDLIGSPPPKASILVNPMSETLGR
jgi:hypothetical protein